MAYWGGAGMNFIGGATQADRKEFLATYDAWLAANGRTARVPKGVYVPRTYVRKPKKDGTYRAELTPAQKAARLLNLEKARASRGQNLTPMQKLKKRNAREAASKASQKASRQAKAAAKKALAGILGNINY